MKKTLASLATIATLSGFAVCAGAASVQLYGTVDTGVLYTRSQVTGEKATTSFEQASGLGMSSVWGLRGSEELGNGMTVSILLESGFDADSGHSDPDRLFSEEASVTVSGDFGALTVGRMGALTSGYGTYDLFMATGDAMDGGHADHVAACYWLDRDIYNNTVTYRSPEMGGITFYAQYSLGTDDDKAANRSKERYAALGLAYKAGKLDMALIVDTVMKNRSLASGYERDLDDAVGISFGMNYDAGFMKAFFGIQYGKHENTFAGAELEAEAADLDGYSLAVGSAFPVCGGELQISAYYANGDGSVFGGASDRVDVNRRGVGAFHYYELSRRTSVYVGAGYDQMQVDAVKTKATQVLLGLTHGF